MKYNYLKEKNGFSMVELLVSIFLLSFGILSVYGAFSSLVIQEKNVSNKFIGIYIAKEGMEIARNIRDNNFVNGEKWDTGLSGCDNGCQADYKTGTAAEAPEDKLKKYNDKNYLAVDTDGFYSYGAGSNTIFKRKITITSQGQDKVDINVQVFWSSGGRDFSFTTEGS